MEKVVERWRSDRMQQDITLARWGHFGVPVLVFPTAGGDAEEVERHHLVGHLAGLVEDGRIKVYSCDSTGTPQCPQRVKLIGWCIRSESQRSKAFQSLIRTTSTRRADHSYSNF